ncbi:lipoyl(octanoyl) transferase LipB [Trichloromonas sp.]|uniref:lipoyl(octanoyl) transferase LipB n=1 Tax=Trichloromonas sp. TaxID=3069249 RepID=UPI002A4CC99F|nr:lipoyl(octanoyl) transferase LipB [Trichloromonas sp.]
MPVQVIDCGVMDYHLAFALQQRLITGIADGSEPETLLLVEHPGIYTLGTGGNEANRRDPAIIPLRVNRGGDITWHGPGQLVGYPLVNLGLRGRDLHRWLRFIENVVIRTVSGYGVKAWRVPGQTGVWTAGGKLAAIGVGVRRWVTLHGFALNVAPDMSPFARIHPCGIQDCPVTSLLKEAGQSPSMPEIKTRIRDVFLALLAEDMPRTESAAPPVQKN